MKKLFTILAIAALYLGASAQVVQQYGFETSEGYNVGNAQGQPGIAVSTASPPDAVITTEQANPGVQSLKISGKGLNPPSTTPNTSAVAFNFPTQSGVATIAFNAYFTPSNPAGNECLFQIIPVLKGTPSSTVTTRLAFDASSGGIYAFDEGTSPGSFVFANTYYQFNEYQWHSFRIVHDFLMNSIKFYMDNVEIYETGVLAATSVDQLQFVNDNWSSSMYIDNVQIINGLLGTAEAAASKTNIVVYPNPTVDVLNINTKNNSKIKDAKVFDASGKLVLDKMSGNTVDVRALKSGAYIINVETADGVTTSEKFIKK